MTDNWWEDAPPAEPAKDSSASPDGGEWWASAPVADKPAAKQPQRPLSSLARGGAPEVQAVPMSRDASDLRAPSPKTYDPLATAVATELGNTPERLSRGAAGLKLASAEAATPVYGKAAAKLATGGFDEELKSVRADIAAKTKAYQTAKPGDTQALIAELDALRQKEEMLIQATQGGGQDYADSVFGSLTNTLGQANSARESITQAESTMVAANPKPGFDEALVSGVASIGDMAPGLAATLLTQNPLPMMVYMGAYSRGSTYVDKRAEGYDPETALTAANLYAATEAIPEALPLAKLLERGVNPLSKIAGVTLAEGVSEVITQGLQQLVDIGYLKEDMTWAEASSELTKAGAAGLVMGSLMGGAGVAVDTGAEILKRRAAGKQIEVVDGSATTEQRAALATDAAPAGTNKPPARPVAADDVAPDAALALNKTTKDIARNIIEARRAAPAPQAVPTAVTPEVTPPAAQPEPATQPEASTTPPEPAPVATQPEVEVAPEAAPAETPVAEGDTQQTVPEAPDTLAAQNAALVDPKSKRKAVFIPFSSYEAQSAVEPEGKNIGQVVLPGAGVLFFNKAKGYTRNDILALYRDGKLGQVLGLGEITKADAQKSAAKGATPVAVTERTPAGVEVKAAAGTTETAPSQVAELEALKDEGNTVQVEEPATVIQERQAAQLPAVFANNEITGNTPADVAANAELGAGLPAEVTPPTDKAAAVRANTLRQLEPRLAQFGITLEEALALPTPKQVSLISKARAAVRAAPAAQSSAKPETKAEKALQPADVAKERIILDASGKPKSVMMTDAEHKTYIEEARAKWEATIDEAKKLEKQREEFAKEQAGEGKKAEAKAETEDKRLLADAGRLASVDEEVEARFPEGHHKSAATVASAKEEARKAAAVVKKLLPEFSFAPDDDAALSSYVVSTANTEPGLAALLSTQQSVLDKAKAAGVKIPAKVTPMTTNAHAWLAQVKATAAKIRRLKSGSVASETTSAQIRAEIRSFLEAEYAFATTGSTVGLREIRKEEGEAGTAAGPTAASESDAEFDIQDENGLDPEAALIAKQEAIAAGEFEPADELPPVDQDPEPVTPEVTPQITGVEFDENGKPVVKQRSAVVVETKKPKARTLTKSPSAAANGATTKVFRAQRVGGVGAGVGEAAFGIGRYWAADLSGAERYKDIVVPVTISGPGGSAVLNLRDTLNNKQALDAALKSIGVGAEHRPAVVRFAGGDTNTALPEGVSVDVGKSEIVNQELDTTAFVEQTGKARYNEYDLNNPEDIQALREQGIRGTSYVQDGKTNYVEFPPAPRVLKSERAAPRTGNTPFEEPLTPEEEAFSELLTPEEFDALTDEEAADVVREDLRANGGSKGFYLDEPQVLLATEVLSPTEYVERLQEDAKKRGLTNEPGRFLEVEEKMQLTSFMTNLQRTVADKLPDLHIFVVSRSDMDLLHPPSTYGYGVDGFYSEATGNITLAADSIATPGAAYNLFMHEASHALFAHELNRNKALHTAVDKLRLHVLENVLMNENLAFADGSYGFKDAHEFLAEAFSNPEFQLVLGRVPITAEVEAALGTDVRSSRKKGFASALEWLRRRLSEIVGTKAYFESMLGIDPDTPSALEASMEIAKRLMKAGPAARRQQDFSSLNRTLFSMTPPKTKALQKRLIDRGITGPYAMDVMAVVNEEFDGRVTDEELDAIASALGQSIAIPTGQTPAGAPPMPPRVATALRGDGNPAGYERATTLRRGLLAVQTLDYITRRYASLFKDKQGNALEDYERAVFEHDPVRREIEERHNRDFAAFEELRRSDPLEAEKLASLMADLAPYDVNLGAGADGNKHLGKGKMALQALEALPSLEAAYAALKPETRAIMDGMAANYRKTHNDQLYGVIHNLLASRTPRLSNSEIMRLTDAAFEGRLTEDDRLTINNKVIFESLVNAKELQRRHGLYFPSMRMGDHVVLTTAPVKGPTTKSITTRRGDIVPVKTEVDGGTVRFVIGETPHGAKTALERAVDQYVKSNDMTMSSYRIKYRDKLSGEVVTKSGQKTDREYDYFVELKFQNEGVHFFEDVAEAEAFAASAAEDVQKGVLTQSSKVMPRRNTPDISPIIKGSAAESLLRSIEARSDAEGKARMKETRALVADLVMRQMPGNRYEKRLLKRKNVRGFSKEYGRTAAYYGRQAGNYMAAVMTSPARHAAFDRMLEIERATEQSRPAVNQVMNELRARNELMGLPVRPDMLGQIAADIKTLNGLDKLASMANWMLNGSQVIMATLPLLGGRFGNARASMALASAYWKMGAARTVGRGLANTAIAIKQARKFELDTMDITGKVRERLGPEYHDLVDEMLAQGDLSMDIGIENAAALSSGRGVWGKGLAIADRVARQMPNTVEVVNRTATAVAAYDLARKSGNTHKDAIEFAIDAARQTQGRYDSVNSPRFMQDAGALSFMFVFKKYALLQYQLIGDIAHRALKDASPQERAVARKQLSNLVGVTFLFTGALGLPVVSEAAKIAVTVLSALFGADDWEEEQARWREATRDIVGQDWEQIINKGTVSKLLDVDLQSRMGWQDMLSGFQPSTLDRNGLFQYIGTMFAGAPGGMLVDWTQATRAAAEGDYAKALRLMIPLKQAADTVKAASDYQKGDATAGDAVRQFIGFRSLAQAEAGDKLGAEIRAKQRTDKERKKLVSDFLNARTTAEIAEARRAIEEWDRKLPSSSRQRIGIKGLMAIRKREAAQ